MPESLALTSAYTQLISAFVAGFLSSLTPCVYPLIPITLSIFGATSETGRLRSFLLSLTYVLGISLTYTVLGLFSARSGAIFGQFLGNPWVILTVSILLIILSLFTLDIISIDLSRVQTRANRIGGPGFLGAFLMGTVSGFVAAPCVGPVLVVILGIAASSQSAIWGGALLFSYSLGLGIIFVILGTFSGLINRIPRSGNWLFGVKFLMAVMLLMVVFFLGQSYTPKLEMLELYLLSGIAVAIALFSFKREFKSMKLLAALILAFSLTGIFIPAPPVNAGNDTALHWINTESDALSAGKSKNSIIMIDLFAEWCAACKELESLTFSDSKVQELLKKIITARIDFTDSNEVTEKVAEKYGVIGLPCVIFLNPDGTEIPDTRLTGFVPPEKFIELLHKAGVH